MVEEAVIGDSTVHARGLHTRPIIFLGTCSLPTTLFIQGHAVTEITFETCFDVHFRL
jgi:hypothetical protein